MDRRTFMKASVLVPGVFSAPRPDVHRLIAQAKADPTGWRVYPYKVGPPPTDQPWPIDIRDGFENVDTQETATLEVWLDGVKARGVVAVSEATGHLLKFRFYTEGVPHVPGMPLTDTVIQKSTDCTCSPGMHWFRPLYIEDHRGTNDDLCCIPYELKTGRVELRRRA